MSGDYIYFLGEVRAFAFGYNPKNWLPCDGSQVKINEYADLFSLLGTIYGGDGLKTFCLPDLRGRMIINKGQGPGLSARQLGDKGGQETVSAAADKAVSGTGNNMPPFLTLNYCICAHGEYPTRE